MLPNLNFNPSFANLAALHGLGGGMPHPIRPIGGPVPWQPPPMAPMDGNAAPMQPPSQMPAQMPYSGMPAQGVMPMQPQMPGQMPQGNLGNLQALMRLLQQGGSYQ